MMAAPPQTVDILAALAGAVAPARGTKRCKVQRILDDIDPSTRGHSDLLAAVDDPKTYPAQRLTLTFSLLGHPVSPDIINDHRANRCACYR
jgi:hypothetical protein